MSQQQFPIHTAQLVSLWMESIFYGIFLVTFFACVKVLVLADGHFKRWQDIRGNMLFAALAMFATATTDMSFGLAHNIIAFVKFDGKPIDQFGKINSWMNVGKMATFVIQTFIGDSILLYRCWLVYNRNFWVILLPILMWLAETACGTVSVVLNTRLTDPNVLLNSSNVEPFITTILALTVVVNVLTTGLIVYRIRTVRMDLGDCAVISRHPLSNLLRIMIESGLIYTTSAVVLFCVYVSSSRAQFTVAHSVVQIIGITFNLIIIRVGRGIALRPSTGAVSLSMNFNSPTPLKKRVSQHIVSTKGTLTSDTESSPHLM